MRALTVAFLLAATALGFAKAEPELSLSTDVKYKVPYSNKVAMEAIYYAKTSYCPAAQIGNWTCPACKFNTGMQEVSVFTARETQAYVGFDIINNNVVVAFRGSSNVQNWIDNLTFELVDYAGCGGCKVHKGFLEIYAALQVNLIPYVKAAIARHPTATIFVTGHSLGGAQSTLAALDLLTVMAGKTVHVYNFGEPRVGNPAFVLYAANALSDKGQYRITHKADPVPKIPFQEFGYLHVPHEIFFDNDGNTTWVDCQDSATAEDKSCSLKYPFGFAFSDHTHYMGVSSGCSVTATDLMIRGLNPNLVSSFNAVQQQSQE